MDHQGRKDRRARKDRKVFKDRKDRRADRKGQRDRRVLTALPHRLSSTRSVSVLVSFNPSAAFS
jgi:hypothetical protein